MTQAADTDLKRLARLEHRMAELDRERIRIISEAQRHGASWDAIAGVLGTTKQSAWETYRLRVKNLLDATASSADTGEDELLDSAAASLARVRTRRRP